jgi:hypothetical protein
MPSVGEISGSAPRASFFPAVRGMMPCDWPWISGFLGALCANQAIWYLAEVWFDLLVAYDDVNG